KSDKKPDKSDSKNRGRLEQRIKKDKKEFLEVFRENMAIITISCLKKGIHRSTFYDWYKSDDEFAAKVEEIRKEQVGVVEDKLLKAILDDNLQAIIFYLKSKHPDYKPKTQIDFSDKEKMDQTLDEISNLINGRRKTKKTGK
ncbi:hypothetical protein, partial [Caldithrix abyssi]